MRVAYVVNRYPRTSHSFIRREILAVEAHGVEVLRFSLRPLDQEIVDEGDRSELERTRVVLSAGAVAHARAVLALLLRSPAMLLRGAAAAARLGWRSDRGMLRNLAYLAEACVLARWAREDHVDHLHAHFGTNSAAVAMLCREVGGPPYSMTVHGSEEFDKPEALRLGAKVTHAVFAVAVSHFGRAQLLRWVREEDWSKVHVVHCGVDDLMLDSTISPIPSEPRIVCVARLVAGKGHVLLVEAAARLAAEGIGFEIVLVGDGPLRARIQTAIREHGVEDRIRIAGWMSAAQVRDAIRESQGMVLPSFSEGLPVVLMESLALGRPVISTAVGGVPELVEPGVTGWLVPAGSVDALASAMRAFFRTPTDRLAEMGRAGAARITREHDASKEALKLVDLFRASAAIANAGTGRPDGRSANQDDGASRGSRGERSAG